MAIELAFKPFLNKARSTVLPRKTSTQLAILTKIQEQEQGRWWSRYQEKWWTDRIATNYWVPGEFYNGVGRRQRKMGE
ncbi:hypothetical protein ACFXTH_014249 [Malus domestica]